MPQLKIRNETNDGWYTFDSGSGATGPTGPTGPSGPYWPDRSGWCSRIDGTYWDSPALPEPAQQVPQDLPVCLVRLVLQDPLVQQEQPALERQVLPDPQAHLDQRVYRPNRTIWCCWL